MSKWLAPYGYSPEKFIATVWAGTEAMITNDGSRTNEEAFWDTFSGAFGEKARADEPKLDAYYREQFDKVSEACGYTPKAKEAVELAKKNGRRVVLATNPIFPSIATEKRMKWAGLDKSDFEFFTTYENSCYTKPNLKYYEVILEKLGVSAEDCLMVGNDVTEDMVAKKLGMKVFLLTDCIINKNGEDISAYPHGDFDALIAYLENL